jgi:hypothetical protein
VLVVNDSPIKQFAENRHAVGQSVLESLLRITNRATNGRRITVFGYGACGKGVATNLRNAYAIVSVIDVDPVARLEALFDGFLVPEREEALAKADVIVTVTGAASVVTAADLPLLKDGVILLNAGHFPWEIDVASFEAGAALVTGDDAGDLKTLQLEDGRRIHVLAEGHMINLAGPRPLGNSIESMDIGFALQARCLEAVASGAVGGESCVVPVPRYIDEMVASSYLRTRTVMPPADGGRRDAREGVTIRSFSGKTFWPLEPRTADVDIVDIARRRRGPVAVATGLDGRAGARSWATNPFTRHRARATHARTRRGSRASPGGGARRRAGRDRCSSAP